MTEKKKVILDANVYISALLYKGLPQKVLHNVTWYHRPILADELIDEVLEKLTKKFNVGENIILQLQELVSVSEIIEIPLLRSPRQSPDPDDDYLLVLAEMSEADYLVIPTLFKQRTFFCGRSSKQAVRYVQNTLI